MGYRKQYVATADSGTMTEAETFTTAPLSSGASSSLSSAASALPPAGPVPVCHGSSHQSPFEQADFLRSLFLRNKDQAHQGTLLSKKKGKLG